MVVINKEPGAIGPQGEPGALQNPINETLVISPPAVNIIALQVKAGADLELEIENIAPAGAVAPVWVWWAGLAAATQRKWVTGIDISAEEEPYANLILAGKIDYPAPGNVYDLITCNYRAGKEPAIGIGTGTTYKDDFRLAVQGSTSNEAPEKTLGTLLLKAGKEQTANVLEVIDYGGAKHAWYEPDATTSNWALRLRGDSTTGNPIISVQDKTTDTPTFEVLANGEIRLGGEGNRLRKQGALALRASNSFAVGSILYFAEDENAGLDRPEAGVLRVRNALKILGDVGFYNTAPVAKGAVTGSRGGNAALTSLLEKLALTGLITNSTEA